MPEMGIGPKKFLYEIGLRARKIRITSWLIYVDLGDDACDLGYALVGDRPVFAL